MITILGKPEKAYCISTAKITKCFDKIIFLNWYFKYFLTKYISQGKTITLVDS